jgi:hypothetical protein
MSYRTNVRCPPEIFTISTEFGEISLTLSRRNDVLWIVVYDSYKQNITMTPGTSAIGSGMPGVEKQERREGCFGRDLLLSTPCPGDYEGLETERCGCGFSAATGGDTPPVETATEVTSVKVWHTLIAEAAHAGSAETAHPETCLTI